MAEKTSRFINVDELMPTVTVEQAAEFYGIDMGAVHEVGKEIRTRCFLAACAECDETGDRAIAINRDSPIGQWKCHQYGCGRGGNLLGMMDLMKPGENCNGRPRGARFKELAADLKVIANGDESATPSPATPSAPQKQPPAEAAVNIPLAESDKPAAQALVTLHEKFLIVPDKGMNKHAASYMRKRPYLTEAVCTDWQCGYLPHDTGGDKTGGTLRGRFIYPMKSENGQVLAWFGRDPEWEQKHDAWERGGKRKQEPNKFTFPKNFRRGLELFGQDRFCNEASGEVVEKLGIVVVEGPNDVIALHALGIPSLGVCTNHITDDQVAKLTGMATELDVPITIMFDNDQEGEKGAQQAIWKLAERCPVRLGWSPTMYGGKFRNRQPESLDVNECIEIQAFLASERQEG